MLDRAAARRAVEATRAWADAQLDAWRGFSRGRRVAPPEGLPARADQADQGRDPNLSLPALDTRDLHDSQTGVAGQVLLRPAAREARSPHVGSEAFRYRVHRAGWSALLANAARAKAVICW